MIRRVVLAVLAAVMFAGVTLVGTASPAHALDICKDVPTPMSPKSGMAGVFTARPAQPSEVDPFKTPSVPIHDVYGTSWHWHVYDLGCTTFADIPAITNTQTGNFLMGLASTGVALTDLFERTARGSGFEWVADAIGPVMDAVRPIVFGGSSPAGPITGVIVLALVVAAAWIIFGAHKANIGEAAKAGIICVVCIAVATFSVAAPVFASRSADQAVTAAADVASSSFNASLTDGVNRQSLYRAWLQGQFGDADWKPGIDNYGPRIVDATRYKWSEWDRIQADPAAAKEIDQRKADEYKAVADEIEEQYPSVYTHFQGRGVRTEAGLLAVFLGLVIGLFAFIAFGTIWFARLFMQILVVAAPVAAVAGMLPKGGGVLFRMFHLFVAAIVAVFKFTLAAGLMAVTLGLLSRVDDPATAVVSMGFVSVGALVLLRPFKTFKTFVPGLDPNRSYVKELGGLVAKLGASAATGGAAGAAMAGASAANAGPVQAGDLTVNQPAQDMQRVALSAGPSPAPLPAPVFHQIEGTNRFVGTGYGAEPPAEGVARQPLPVSPSGSGGAMAELPAGRVAGSSVRVDGVPRMVIDGPVRVAAPGQDQVVISGEIVPEGGTYQRPTDRPQPPQPALPPPDRDRGTDQPLDELSLYQSRR